MARTKTAAPPSDLKPTIPLSLADRVIGFIERYCVYPEGRLVGRPIVLPEFHKEIIRGIYEEVEDVEYIAGEPHTYTRFKHRLSIVSLPRKQAKSGLMASLLLAHLCGPCVVKNSQLYSCAFSRAQAAILFRYAAKMVQQSGPLAERIRIRNHDKELLCPRHGTLYKALSKDAKVSFGLSPQVCFFDELGQAGAHMDLWDAMDTAKGAVFNPVTIVISTQAPDDTSLLSVLIDDHMQNARDGVEDGVFLYLVSCPQEIDPLDEKRLCEWIPAWREAWCNTHEIIEMCKRAARLPSERARFLNLIANRRVRMEAGLFTPDVWDACNGSFDLAEIQGRPAWGGLDLSQTTDLTAFVLVVPMDDGTCCVLCRFYLPAHDIDQRSKDDKIDYRLWSEQGHLTLIPGKIVDYEVVIRDIIEDAERFDIREIAYDRYRIKTLRNEAEKVGAELPTLVEFGQGFVSMSPAVQELENAVLREQLRHAANPVLRWNMANVVIKVDPAGNRKPVKDEKRHRRIDGAVALMMAYGQWRKTSAAVADVSSWIG